MLTHEVTASKSLQRRLLLCAVSVLGALGCAPDDAGVAADGEAQDELSLIAPIDQQSITPNADLPFFAAVTANGTGCPKGSWSTDISSDGLTFTTHFDQYVARAVDGQRSSFKDCNLTIKLRSPAGLSYAVSDFFYTGFVGLEEGVRAFQTANYYFQGNPVPSVDKEKRTDLTGPVFRSYLFQDTVRTVDAVWSPCGLDRNLNVVTRLGVQKANNIGEGEISLLNLDGQVDGKVVLKLAWRSCATSTAATGGDSGSSTSSGGRTVRR